MTIMSATRWSAWARRHLLGLLLAVAVSLGTATVAVAFWTIGLHPNPEGSGNGAQLSAPTTPTATVNGSEAITVGWSVPGSQLTGAAYQVTRTSGPGSPVVVCTVSTTSCQDSGLTPGKTYGYSIAAVLGTSWRSSAITTSATTATPVFTITLSAGPYTAGTPITVQTVSAKVGGVTDTTYTGAKTITWSGLATSPAPSSTAPTYPSSAVTFSNGVASPGTTATAYDATGNTLVATDAAATGVTGSVTFSVSATTTGDTMSIVQGNNQSATVGAALTTAPEVNILDPYSNPVPGMSVTFTAPASGASGTFAASTTATTTVSTGATGNATASAFTVNHVAGTYSITTSASGVASPATFTETNTAGTATTIAIVSGSSQSASVTSAFTNPLVALVTDTYGNPVAGATVTFTAPASGASATVRATSSGSACLASGGSAQTSCTAVTDASGRASSLTLTANTVAGSYNVAATSAGTTPNPLNFAETNTAGTATKLAFVTQPSANQNVQATGTGTFAASVAVEDANGNIETGDNTTTVTFAIGTNPSSGVLTCTNGGGLGPVAVTNGVAGFTGCAITRAGNGYTLTASSSPSHTAPANANSFNITAGTASTLAFVTQPSSNQNIQATGTGTFSASVAVQDANGNTVTGDNSTTVTLAIGTNPSSGVLSCTNTGGLGPVTVSSGVAGFTGCAITKAGNGYTLTATSGGLTAPTNANSFNITAGNASIIAAVSGGGQSATVGAAFTNPLVALVTDADGNPVSGAAVTFAGPSSGASVSFASCTSNPHTYSCVVNTASNGQATSSAFTANTTAGSYSIAATSPGTTPNPLNFTETNTPGTASKLAFTVQPSSGQSIQATGTGTFAVSVAVQDANGNTETGDNATAITLAIGTNPSSGVLSCTNTGGLGPATVSNGVAAFTGCAITKAGTGYVLTASSSPVRTAPTNGNAFTITAGSATQLLFTTEPGSDAGTGALSPQPVVTVEDANGNVETGDNATTVTLAINTNPGSGSLHCYTGTADTTDSLTVTVSGGVATFAGCALQQSAAGPTAGYKLQATSSPANGTVVSTAFSVTKSVPTVTSPTAAMPCNPGHNGTANCVITGTNFAPGVRVTISANGTVNSVTWNSATQITINVTGNGANKATGNVTVTNPDGGAASVANGFSNG